MRNQPLAGPIVIIASLAACASRSAAQSYDFDWATIGDPGNDPWRDDRYPFLKFNGRGRVDHLFRMSKTELTVGQWAAFVRAYGPHAEDPFDPELTGWYIWGERRGDQIVYEVEEGFERHPAQMSWRMAARFCNWMHNGQSGGAWAFESGAYDTSTFTRNDDGPPYFNDQETRSPGARYWIPSMDEWMKAAYYDPDRFGEGDGGWWEQPDRGNDPLFAERPENGGETNAGLFHGDYGPLTDVGQYPHATSPWGLLDLSGAMREFTEEWDAADRRAARHVKGSSIYDDISYQEQDWIGSEAWAETPNIVGTVGFRVASAVPAHPTWTVLCAVGIGASRRRRR